MLLVGRVTWTLSACVQLRHVIFLSPYIVESTGSMGGIDVFAASGGTRSSYLRVSALNSLIVDLPEPELLMKQKHDVLTRFLGVLKLLVEVYTIPQTSLNIFADKDGRFISFNRCGNLFLNLRYFEAWRTSCVSALL